MRRRLLAAIITSLVIVFGTAGCAQDHAVATAPEIASPPDVADVTLSGSDTTP